MTDTAALRLALSLVFIIMLILAGAWVIRRAGWLRAGANQTVQILGTKNLGARAHVALIQIGAIRMAVGITAQQVSLLHTWTGDAGAHDGHAACDPPHESFHDALDRSLDGDRQAPRQPRTWTSRL